MKLNPTLQTWLGTLLILLGVLIGLALSASITWGYSEAGLYSSYTADTDLPIKCPLMLAPNETGKVSANIANLINEKITPTVRAQISHSGEPRTLDQIVTLEP